MPVIRLYASCSTCHAGEEAGIGGDEAAVGEDGYGALVCLSCGQSAYLSPSLDDYLQASQDPAMVDTQLPRILERGA